MASQSLATASFSTPIGFFEPVDRGDPLTRVQAIKQAADTLLSFGSSGHVLKFENGSFAYVKLPSIEKRLNPALKAVLCFALIAAPFARLLYALWVKRPINASLALPLAIPVGIFLAKYSFRSNLTSIPSRIVKEGNSENLEIGFFRNGELVAKLIPLKDQNEETVNECFNEFLTNAGGEESPLSFTQLNAQKLRGFIELFDAQKELPSTQRRQILEGLQILLSQDPKNYSPDLIKKLKDLQTKLSLKELEDIT